MPHPQKKKPTMITRPLPPQQLLAGACAAKTEPGTASKSFNEKNKKKEPGTEPSSPSMIAEARPLGPRDAINQHTTHDNRAPDAHSHAPQEELQMPYKATQVVAEACADAWSYLWTDVSVRAWDYMLEVAESVQVGYAECIEDLVLEIEEQLFGVNDKPHNVLATNAAGIGWITLSSSISANMISYFHIVIPCTTGVTLGCGCFVLGIAFLGFCYAQLRTQRHVTDVLEYQAVVCGMYGSAGWVPLLCVGAYASDWVCKFLVVADCGLLFFLNRCYALIVYDITNQAGFNRMDLQTCRLASQVGMGTSALWMIILAQLLC